LLVQYAADQEGVGGINLFNQNQMARKRVKLLGMRFKPWILVAVGVGLLLFGKKIWAMVQSMIKPPTQ
jgi:hypothetical protein